jgi:hypothetical protein
MRKIDLRNYVTVKVDGVDYFVHSVKRVGTELRVEIHKERVVYGCSDVVMISKIILKFKLM